MYAGIREALEAVDVVDNVRDGPGSGRSLGSSLSGRPRSRALYFPREAMSAARIANEKNKNYREHEEYGGKQADIGATPLGKRLEKSAFLAPKPKIYGLRTA